MENCTNTKTDFIQSLIDRNLFWSYSITDAANLPDELLIEQVLGYGEPNDIVDLKKFFKLSQIKQVWQHHLLPDSRFKNANVWLAKVFFNIRRADKYIEKYSIQKNRYDRLRILAAKS
ncbi:MAG: hypothetical protein D4R64_02535 [Porphyromonadaceae bacterium]|nr:MAG: hypothetical protein D4R64_02535 [Porphyromonadaceae bacterium]